MLFSKRLILINNKLLSCFCTTIRCSICKYSNVANAKGLNSKESSTKKLMNQNEPETPILQYFRSRPHLKQMEIHVPKKYLQIKRTPLENVYLVDKTVAENITSFVLPILKQTKDQIICETNAGLGLIASELLQRGIKLVRLYEPCPEFRVPLKDFNEVYPGRVEIFKKDLYQISKMSFLDKTDKGNRVKMLLKGVPKKNWTDDVVMTIIGPMPNTVFISYLLRSLALQCDIINYGRIQLFAIMKPADFIKLSALPPMNYHTYQSISILFNLFFDYEFIGKYPREAFLPWERKKMVNARTRYPSRIDPEFMYLVRINMKSKLPIDIEHILPFYYFVRQGFGRGTNKVIPTVEKWLPDCGMNLIAATNKSSLNYYQNMGIFTQFGQLTPAQILHIFYEILAHPAYKSSPFAALVDSEVLKTETLESDLVDDSVIFHENEDLQEKLV